MNYQESEPDLLVADMGRVEGYATAFAGVPVVRVDPTGRPEISDLPRVFAQEGPKAELSDMPTWDTSHVQDEEALILHVNVAVPVRATLRLRFNLWGTGLDALYATAKAEHLGFVISPETWVGPRRTALERPAFIAVPPGTRRVVVEALRALLEPEQPPDR